MRQWRLLDTGSRTAAENMALDEVLLIARYQGIAPNTIRFLQFNPPCVLVGFHQVVEQEVRLEYCRREGIEINRRITGGGALFWDTSQLGWEVITTLDYPGVSRRLEHLYAQLCGAVARALQRLGVPAAYRPRNDIEVRGRKISGTGGTELGGAFLYQGTLLINFDVETMLRALRIPTEKLKAKEIDSLKERVTCLKWELGRVPPLATIKQVIAEEFSREFHMELVAGGLTPAEESLLAERQPYFQSRDWINAVQGITSRTELRSGRRTRGGFIRSSLVLGPGNRRIDSLYLTGDFFAHPRRAIFDLEASLKGLPAEPEIVTREVNEFFRRTGARLPGIKPSEVAATINDALAKKDYLAQGIPVTAVNSVYTVGKPLAEITVAPVVLLPYCAKLPTCRFRNRQGCSQCGRCDIGTAYALARQYGLEPLTIQNYEMLARVLQRLKKEGAPAFLGSCCEAFLTKHRRDLERIGLPGILVDIDSSTCYELGQENAAHAGLFEKQTSLKMNLLEFLLARVAPHQGRGQERVAHA
ncbi:MAG: lipoate---protein ligase [Clostridia bacterium]|nr:lipoate---protein ligase [Clostridia bacterium]